MGRDKGSEGDLEPDELESVLKALMIVAGAGLGISVGGLAAGWDHVPLRHGLICVLVGCLWLLLFTLAAYVTGGLYLHAKGPRRKEALNTSTALLIVLACIGFLIGILDGWPAVRGKSTLFSDKIINEVDEHDFKARLERARQDAEIETRIRAETLIDD